MHVIHSAIGRNARSPSPDGSGSVAGVLALVIATSAWGSMFVLGKDVLQHISPFWLAFFRSSIASIPLTLMLIPRGAAPWRDLRDNALTLTLHGFLGFCVFGVMLVIGLGLSPPSHGAVILATMPMTAQLFGWAIDGARPSRTSLLTALLALAGVVVVSGLLSGSAIEGRSVVIGDTVALIGTIAWVVYARGAAKVPQLDALEYSALTMLVGLPFVTLVALIATALGYSDFPTAGGLRATWPALIFIGLIPSALSALAFNYGVRAIGTVNATAFMNFVPVSALTIGAFFGDLPSITELVGIAMVVCALLINTAMSKYGAAKPAS